MPKKKTLSRTENKQRNHIKMHILHEKQDGVIQVSTQTRIQPVATDNHLRYNNHNTGSWYQK